MTDEEQRTVESQSEERLSGVRRFVAQRYTTIVVLLLVLLVIGGAFTATTLAGSEEDAQQEAPESVSDSGDFTHSAVVQNGTEVFEEGDELQDRRTYFTRVSPELDVEYEYRHDTLETDLDVDTELQLQLQSSDDEEVYWELSEPLDDETAASFSPGETLTLDGTVDMADLTERVDRIEEELGSSPGDSEIQIIARSEIEGTIGNDSVAEVREDVLVVTPDGETYSVETRMDHSGTSDRTAAVGGTAEEGWLRTIGAPLLTAVSLLGLVAVVGAEKRGHLRLPEDAEYLSDRKKFDDWITTGSLPASLADRPTIEVDSLEGLVDVAIDSDRRVIEDPSTSRFYVAEDSVLYRYDPTVDSGTTDAEKIPEPEEDGTSDTTE